MRDHDAEGRTTRQSGRIATTRSPGHSCTVVTRTLPRLVPRVLRKPRQLRRTAAVVAVGVGLSGCRDFGSPLDTGNVTRVPTTIAIVAPAPPYRVLVDQALQFRAEVRDQSGLPIADRAIEWTSSVPTVASIDANGRALGLTPGQTLIHATSDTLTSAAVTVEVVETADVVASVVIVSPTDARVVVGGTLQFVAEARDAQGVLLTEAIAWQSSAITVATIDTTGLARGLGAGTTAIRASAGDIVSDPVLLTVLDQAPDFDTEIQPIFTARCALSGCHAGANPQEGLSLVLGVAYDAIVQVPSNRLPEWLLVSPGDPAASLLYRKVSDSTPPTGARMPLGGALGAADIQRLRDWIAAGAQR